MFTVFGNGTDGVSWTSEPRARGTFSILSSCVVTILLCVWTALHLNIPDHEDEGRRWISRRSLWSKVTWLIFALVAPELVAYTAFYQRSEAVKLRKFLVALVPEDTKDLSMTQAFYAIMGGYQIYVPIEDNPFSGHHTHFPLNRESLQHFAEACPHLLKIAPDDEIKDKSKANGLAKSLVCVQATWFIFQCISCMAMSLPITLLELNTLGHSLCALIIYLFWWHKPLDIQKPTLITGPEAKKYAAYLWLTSENGTPFDIHKITPLDQRQRETEILQLIRKDEMDGWWITHYYELGFISKEACTIALALRERVSARSAMRTYEYWGEQGPLDEESLVDFRFSPSQTNLTSQEGLFDHDEVVSQTPEPTESHDGEPNCKANLVRMVDGLYYSTNGSDDPLACEAIVSLASEFMKNNLTVRRITYDGLYSLGHTVDRLSDLPLELSPSAIFSSDAVYEDYSKQLNLCLYAAGFLYGGLHLLAWFATFRSSTERLIWRISSATVIASMPVIDVLRLVIRYDLAGGGKIGFAFFFLSMLVRWFCIVFYLIARAYLVVECFIALAYSPIGVYEVPQWSNYVPHIG